MGRMVAVNQTKDFQKTMTQSSWGLFYTMSWAELEKALREGKRPAKQSIRWGNVKGSCIQTANENTLSVTLA